MLLGAGVSWDAICEFFPDDSKRQLKIDLVLDTRARLSGFYEEK